MLKIYILLFVVMVTWGFNLSALAVLVKVIDPVTMTSLRIFVAGVAVLIISKIMGIFRLPTKSEWKTIGMITIFNVVLHHALLAIGLTKTSGVNAGIILGAAPLVTMLLSVIFLRNRVSGIRVIGFLLGFIGIIITSMVGASGLSFASGDVFIFFCMVAQAISFILIAKLNPTFDPRLLTGYMLLCGSFVIFIVAISVEKNVNQLTVLFDSHYGFLFLFSAVIATAMGHMIYNFAVRNVGPAETTIFVNLNTLFALIGAAIFLKESILPNHYLGLAFIVVGVFLGSGTYEYVMERRRQKKWAREKQRI